VKKNPKVNKIIITVKTGQIVTFYIDNFKILSGIYSAIAAGHSSKNLIAQKS